jgi:hypothetical protein
VEAVHGVMRVLLLVLLLLLRWLMMGPLTLYDSNIAGTQIYVRNLHRMVLLCFPASSSTSKCVRRQGGTCSLQERLQQLQRLKSNSPDHAACPYEQQ